MPRLSCVVWIGVASGCTGSPAAPTPEPPPPAAPTAPDPAAPAAPAPVPISKDADWSKIPEPERGPFLRALGEKVYATGDGGIACVNCHQADGTGITGAYPPLVGQGTFMGDCKRNAGFILDGLSGEIVIEGRKYNGVMVPQASRLNDLQIAAVLSYTRTSWGNDYGTCTPEDVAAARKGAP